MDKVDVNEKYHGVVLPHFVETSDVDDYTSEFLLEPLEIGFGITIGNSLRRVLLSSISGFAITSVKIPGVLHEMDSIEGVIDDMINIILNLKEVCLFLKRKDKEFVDEYEKYDEKKEEILVHVSNVTEFTAGMIAESSELFDVANKDLVIFRCLNTVSLDVILTVGSGIGYVESTQHKEFTGIRGVIPIDSIYSPVKNVKIQVSDTRVGDRVDYDSLRLTVTTNGTITPKKTVEIASDLLINHFSLFKNYKGNTSSNFNNYNTIYTVDSEVLEMMRVLKIPLTSMKLSVRASNCLKEVGIRTLGDLVSNSIDDLMKIKNFGKKSLGELQAIVSYYKLSFGMDLSKYKL
jgi:DNA-directed RNA polymerase subunit alpha